MLGHGTLMLLAIVVFGRHRRNCTGQPTIGQRQLADLHKKIDGLERRADGVRLKAEGARPVDGRSLIQQSDQALDAAGLSRRQCPRQGAGLGSA